MNKFRRYILQAALSMPYKYIWPMQQHHKNVIEVEFYSQDSSKVQVDFFQGERLKKFNGWDVSFAKESPWGSFTVDMTGEGDAFRILATVVEIVKDFIQRYDPGAVVFTGKGMSRDKVYSRILILLGRAFPQYEMTDANVTNQKLFCLFKPQYEQEIKYYIKYLSEPY